MEGHKLLTANCTVTLSADLMLCSLFQKRFRLLCLEEMVSQILERMKYQFDGTIFPTRII